MDNVKKLIAEGKIDHSLVIAAFYYLAQIDAKFQ
jgi:hypothetical protein